MSDDDGIDISKVRKGDKIQISLDRSAELESVELENARLKIEKEHLEGTLEAIATKEFQAKCKQYGLDASKSTPEDLKTIMNSERKRAPRSDDSESPSWSQAIGEEREDPRARIDLGSILIDSTKQGLESAIEFLNYKKSHGSNEERQEASRLLSIAVKHQFSKRSEPLDITYESNLKDLLKHPIAIKDEWSDEEKERALKINADILKKRTAWVQKD